MQLSCVYHAYYIDIYLKLFSIFECLNINLCLQVEVGGGKLKYIIGKLSYASPAGLNGPLSKPALIGVIAGIVLLVLIFIAFLIAYRRKSTESNRVLKNMQEQMDILELRVAAECKEGEKWFCL